MTGAGGKTGTSSHRPVKRTAGHTKGGRGGFPGWYPRGLFPFRAKRPPRHAHRTTSKKKYPGKPNLRVAGGTPEITLRKTDQKKKNSRVGAKEMDGQEEPSQEVIARKKIRTRLIKRPKIGETGRGKVDSDQKQLRRENWGRQRRGEEVPEDKSQRGHGGTPSGRERG